MTSNKILIKNCKRLILDLSVKLIKINDKVSYINNELNINSKTLDEIKELSQQDISHILKIVVECEKEL